MRGYFREACPRLVRAFVANFARYVGLPVEALVRSPERCEVFESLIELVLVDLCEPTQLIV